jgi:hypothetical protein
LCNCYDVTTARMPGWLRELRLRALALLIANYDSAALLIRNPSRNLSIRLVWRCFGDENTMTFYRSLAIFESPEANGLRLKLVSSNTYYAQHSLTSIPLKSPSRHSYILPSSPATYIPSKTVTKRGWHHLCREKTLIL